MYISLTNKFKSLSADAMLVIKEALVNHLTVVAIDERHDEAQLLTCTNGADVVTLPYNFDEALEASFEVGKIDGYRELYAGPITFVIFPGAA